MRLDGHMLIVGGTGRNTIAELIAAGASRHSQSAVIVDCDSPQPAGVQKLLETNRRTILMFTATSLDDYHKHRYDKFGIKISQLIKITKP